MYSDLCIDFHVEISFLHLKLTPGVSNLCICCVLGIHSCLFTLSFLEATTDMTYPITMCHQCLLTSCRSISNKTSTNTHNDISGTSSTHRLHSLTNSQSVFGFLLLILLSIFLLNLLLFCLCAVN